MPHAAALPARFADVEGRKEGGSEAARGQLSVAHCGAAAFLLDDRPTHLPDIGRFPLSHSFHHNSKCNSNFYFKFLPIFLVGRGRLSSSVPVFVVRREKVCPGAAAAARTIFLPSIRRTATSPSAHGPPALPLCMTARRARRRTEGAVQNRKTCFAPSTKVSF